MTEGAGNEQVCLLCKGPVGNAVGLEGFQLLCLDQDCLASPQTFPPIHTSGPHDSVRISPYKYSDVKLEPCDSCKFGHWLHYACLEIIRNTLEECECSTFPCPDCQRSFKLPLHNIQEADEYGRAVTANQKGTIQLKDFGPEEADINNNVKVDPLDNNEALENCKVLLEEFQSLRSEVKSCETAVMSACDLFQSPSSPVDPNNLHGIQRSYESIVEDFLHIQEAIKSYAETNQLL